MDDQSEVPSEPNKPEDSEHRVMDSQLIFQGQREIWIDHEGERYRLRITRRNKLILQK